MNSKAKSVGLQELQSTKNKITAFTVLSLSKNDPDVLALKYLEGVDNITLCLDTLDEFADDAFDRQNQICYFF